MSYQILGLGEQVNNTVYLNGIEVDPGEGSFTLEIFPGEPNVIEYGDGRTVTVELNPEMRSMPAQFLFNNPDILKAVETYREYIKKAEREGTEITERERALYARNAAYLNQGTHLTDGPNGTVIHIALEADGELLEIDTDPIPGATLSTPLLRTEKVNVENNIITSIVLRVSTDPNNGLNYDFSLLTTTPEIAAAA